MYCHLNNLDLYFETRGEGIPILTIHGYYPDHHLMSGCMEPLFSNRPGWQRVYIDLPGMGKTKGAEWIRTSDQMLDIVLEFVDRVLPGQRLIIAGESYGGYLARGIIQRRLERVDGLFLLCPLIVADASKRRLPPHVTLVQDPELLQTVSAEEAAAFAEITVVQSRPVLDRFLSEVMVGLQAADKEFLERLRQQGYGFSFDVDHLPEPSMAPSLILLGRQDDLVGYQDAWGLIENYPRATLAVLDKSGHNLQIEQSGLFQALAGEWLERIRAERIVTAYARAAYQSPFSDALVCRPGEALLSLKRDPEWPGWVWCRHMQTGKEAWLPESYLEPDGERFQARFDYTSQELQVEVGDELSLLKLVNGWYWAMRPTGETGWAPRSCFEEVN